MGKIKNNVVTKGFSGKLGDDLVFRQVDNQTVFAKRTLSTKVPTQKQNDVRTKFTEATLFASNAITNAQAKQDYDAMAKALGLRTAYMAAMTDYLTLPEIGSVFTASYKGNAGDIINIKGRHVGKITDVTVSILAANGSVLESGAAAANGAAWHYVATVANPQVAGCKVVVVAHDRLKKESTMQVVL